VQVTTALVQVASETSKQIQSRYRTNSFLDQMNNKFFGPRGLFCMVLTYKPHLASRAVPIDTSATIAKVLTPADSEFREKLKSIRTSSGVTQGEMELPEAAPLIFPALDVAAEDPDQQSALKRASNFVTEYLDRRAQASYVRSSI
jgi:hypothetical protein